ncbi:MAG TPA: helix-turn-helix transcriptional regulator [Gemmatimonadaceae bacterium]|nr:helix-turn-helix transcriptional regulator [Gemmatimonadaceae bacterium]
MTPIRVRLREEREKAGLTQVELAERAGVRQPTISALENRAPGGRIDLDLLEKLAKVLRVEPGVLLERLPSAKGRKP